MFVTLVAVLCQASPGPPDRCVQEIVTDTSQSDVTFESCKIDGQIGIAKWMSEHPIYRTGWTLQRYKCVALYSGRQSLTAQTLRASLFASDAATKGPSCTPGWGRSVFTSKDALAFSRH
jgi:hypothetical protein